MKYLAALVLAAGCATGGAAHTGAMVATPPYALDAVVVDGVRAGQLSASREWERGPGAHAVRADDRADLQHAFARDLGRHVTLAPDAQRRLRITLVLQSPGYYEGLASETTDVALTADVYDPSGARVRTITLREPAYAPLQRPASREERLDAALDRLATRLSKVL